MKRQRSRNRSTGGNSGKPQHNANRAFESNGPDGVKIRGAAQHVFEKYQQLARDALTAGDRVLAESYQQHAEHYFRVLRAVQPQRTAADIIGRDAFTSGYDIDFEDETGNANETEPSPEPAESENDRGEWRGNNNSSNENRYERPRDDRNNNNNDKPREDRQQRDDRPRNFNDRQQRDDRPRNFNRDDRPKDDRPRDERPRDERPRDERPRDERPRDERPRDDRPREERQAREERQPREERPRYDRAERNSDPLPVIEPQASPLTSEAETSGSPILRSHDGGVSHAPAFLQARPERVPAPEAVAEDGEAKPKARRRRAPRTFEGAAGEEGGAAPAVDTSEKA
jgi:hypothetical protein